MRKILITGSLGLLGSSCVRLFREKGWDVTGIDTNRRAYFFGTEEQEGDALSIDIRDEEAINALFAAKKFDAVIHAAGQPAHEWANDHVLEDFDINARGTLVLLEAARTYTPDAPFVHVSTDKVFGENFGHGEKVTEYLGLDFAGRRSFFGCSKTAADIYAQEYMNYLGMKIGVFRPGCITGKNHKGAPQHGFLAYIAKCVRDGIHYDIHGDGVTRDQIHADDLANAFWHFIEDPLPDVYTIGGGQERAVTTMEAIYAFEKLLKKDASYTLNQQPYRKGERVFDVHDFSKFQTVYPEWVQHYSLDDILRDLCHEKN